MKKQVFIIAFLAAMFIHAGSFAAQPAESRTVALTGTYSGLSVAGSQTVHFDTGPAGDPVTVTGHPTDLDNLEVYVKNDKLTVRFRNGYRSKTNKRVDIYVKNPVLKQADVSGSGTINIAQTLRTDESRFSVAGSGRINIAGDLISGKSSALNVSGSGKINIAGTLDTDDAALAVSGSGDLYAERIEAENIKVAVSGSGSLKCNSVNGGTVKAGVTGSGSVRIAGTASNFDAGVAGSGSVHADGLTAGNAVVGTTGSGNVHVRCTGVLKASAAGSGSVYYYGEPARIDYRGKSQRLIKR